MAEVIAMIAELYDKVQRLLKWFPITTGSFASSVYATTSEIADVADTESAGTSPTVARGDHVHDLTDGLILNVHVGSSAGITPDKLSGPLFSYYRNASDNNVTGNGTVYDCKFDTAVVSNANYSTSTGVFTAPAAGKYLLVTKVGMVSGSSGGTQGVVQVVTTGKSYRFDIDPYANRHKASGATSVTIAVIASLAANDTAKVTLQITGDGSDIADFIGGAFSEFAGWRVG